MSLYPNDIIRAVASAAPPAGQPWDGDKIAGAIQTALEAQVAIHDAAVKAWEEGNQEWATTFTQIDVRLGDPAGIQQWQQDTVRLHAAQVAARLQQNKALVTGIFATITALAGTAISGGATAPVLVPQVLALGGQIAAALNSTDA